MVVVSTPLIFLRKLKTFVKRYFKKKWKHSHDFDG